MKESDVPAIFEPFFQPGRAGRLFSVFFRPSSGPPPKVCVLYVPPFADEMNKARRQAALQARQLAQCGLGTLIIDLYGTGDSEGDFVDARWEIWIEDLMSGIGWLRKRGMKRLVLWGVRLGALLAAELGQRLGGDIEGLVLWQPVVIGKLYLSQFLRLRAAAEMISGEGGLDTGSLRTALKRGKSVEVAGYELHPDLAIAIEQRDLREMQIDQHTQVNWLDVVTDGNQSLSPMTIQVINKWQTSGINAHAEAVMGEPFWTTPEITVVTDLLEAKSFLPDTGRA